MLKVIKSLFEVKKELGILSKSADNPFFRSKYADLNTHLQAVEPLLQKNDLILTQPVSVTANGENVVTTTLTHVPSGESIESRMKLVGEVDMQKSGSAITYARRYTLGSLLAMQAEDDDGESAVGRKTAKKIQSKSSSGSKSKPSFKSTNANTGDDI